MNLKKFKTSFYFKISFSTIC